MCQLISLSANACAPAKGGVIRCYIAPSTAITAITVGTGANAGVITGFTVSGGPGVFKKYEPAKNQTAFYNQTGERPNEFSAGIRINQEGFFQINGIDKTIIDAANALNNCCQVVVIWVLANGERLVQGLEIDSTATGGFALSKEGDCRATCSVLSDTAANQSRLEVRVTSSSAELSPKTNMTDAAIEAL
jgi:hypothetical protein